MSLNVKAHNTADLGKPPEYTPVEQAEVIIKSQELRSAKPDRLYKVGTPTRDKAVTALDDTIPLPASEGDVNTPLSNQDETARKLLAYDLGQEKETGRSVTYRDTVPAETDSSPTSASLYISPSSESSIEVTDIAAVNARLSIKSARLSLDNDQPYGATGGVETNDFSPQSLDSAESSTAVVHNAQQASASSFVDNAVGGLETVDTTASLVDTPARDLVPTSGAEYQLPVPRAPQYTTSGFAVPADNGLVDNAPFGDNTSGLVTAALAAGGPAQPTAPAEELGAVGGLAVDLIDRSLGGLIIDDLPVRPQRHRPAQVNNSPINNLQTDGPTVSVDLGATATQQQQQLPQLNVAVITDGQSTDNANAQPTANNQPLAPPAPQNQPPVPQNNLPQPQPQPGDESDSEEMEAGPSGISPPNFKGTATENAEVWLRHFGNYCTYKGYDEARTKALFKVMLVDTAAEWFDSLQQATQDNWGNLKTAFLTCYTTPEFMKYKHAHELFNHKQESKSLDDYLAHMQRLARQINATDDMLCYAVLNGLRPDIKNHVTRQQPQNWADLQKAARVGEMCTPETACPVVTTTDPGLVVQIELMRDQLNQLSAGKQSINTVREDSGERPRRDRSESERRVRFNENNRGNVDDRRRSPSPAPRRSDDSQHFDNDRSRSNSNRRFDNRRFEGRRRSFWLP